MMKKKRLLSLKQSQTRLLEKFPVGEFRFGPCDDQGVQVRRNLVLFEIDLGDGVIIGQEGIEIGQITLLLGLELLKLGRQGRG